MRKLSQHYTGILILLYLQDPEYKVDRASNEDSKKFITQAKKMNIDTYAALDKLYKDPDQISDNSGSKPFTKCNDDKGEDDPIDQLKDDTPKLKYCKETTIDHGRAHSFTFELPKNPRVFEAVKPEHKERKTAAQDDSYYIEKFEQECKR